MERDKTIEWIILMMFVLLVGILIIIFMNFSSSKITTTTNTYTTILDSYNKIQQDTTPKVYYFDVCRDKKCDYPKTKKTRDVSPKPSYSPKHYKDYDSWGNHKREKKSDLYYIDTFEVYVKNYGHSNYFTLRFYFEDCWGEEKIYDVRKYIYSGEKELFYFRDVGRDKCEYGEWKYKII